MILIVDDDKSYADALAAIVCARGYEVRPVNRASSALAAVRDRARPIECIILDVMMPGGESFSREATCDGRYTGLQILANIRATLPEVPVFVTTVVRDDHIVRWLRSQHKCQVWLKPFDPDELLTEIDKTLARLGDRLLGRLLSCPSGRAGYRSYEDLCVDLLTYLFVPPFPAVHVQSRTADGHEIRDAILANASTGGFWGDLRREFDCVNIPCEFKNYRQPIGTREVQQLRLRLEKPSLGRFGLLICRHGANTGAVAEQRLAYSSAPKKLILFVTDETIKSMVGERERNGKPEGILQKLKTEFELSF
jgi:CheY-like chemotaxis protein